MELNIRAHYLGIKIYFGVKSMDLTVGDNAKLVTKLGPVRVRWNLT
jgi:hypothetical protein